MAAPDGRGGPQDIAAAVDQLRRWTASLPAVGEPRERREPQREIADAILDALERRLRGDASSTAEVASSLTAREPDVLRTIDELRVARDTLHRRLSHSLAPELALYIIDELNDLLDDVLRYATDNALRGLRADAFTDVLTGAGNRRAFERDFHRALETSKRHGRDLTVVVLDLDGLKRLNDEHGHAAGDTALRDLAGAFLGQLRAGDGFYRIGGDEFALVLPESGADAVEALLARARVTAPNFSHGWAAHPDDGETSAELLQRADERLFEGRHERRALAAVPQTAPTRARLRFAAAAPVLAALGLAELIRRLSGVELGDGLVASWVGLLVVGAILGPPVARRWCTGHPNVTTTAICASRVGMVVLLILVIALVPVSHLRNALDTAAYKRSLLEHPARTVPQDSGSRSNRSGGDETPQFAFGPLPVPADSVSTASGSTTGRAASALSRPPTVSSGNTPVLIPPASPTLVVQPPLADIGTKTPHRSGESKPLDSGSGGHPHKHKGWEKRGGGNHRGPPPAPSRGHGRGSIHEYN